MSKIVPKSLDFLCKQLTQHINSPKHKKGPTAQHSKLENQIPGKASLIVSNHVSLLSYLFPMEIDAHPNGNSTAAAPPTVVAVAATGTAPSSKLSQLTESLKLEHQFLRVPFEHYKKTIRSNHRIFEKELSSVISGVSEAADGDLPRDDAVQQLNSLVSRLQGLKRKVYIILSY